MEDISVNGMELFVSYLASDEICKCMYKISNAFLSTRMLANSIYYA